MKKENAEKIAELCDNKELASKMEKLFKDIEEYTKDDFLNGTEPYEYCCMFLGNRFEFEQQKNKMNDVAKKCGVRNFLSMLGHYCTKVGYDVADNNYTNFPDQPLTLSCGSYTCDMLGVRSDTDTVCPHSIMPVMRLSNIDTGIEKVKIAYSKGKGWKTLITDRKTISAASKIVDLSDSGISVTSESAKALVKYFAKIEQLNMKLLPEIECVTRLGWIDKDEELLFSPYVEGISFDGEAEYKKHYDSVKIKGDFKGWTELTKRVIRHNNVAARMVFAASLASVLVKPLGCNCFWLHLWGETESAKTVLAMVAASIWGNPEIGSFIHTFNSTFVGMEKTAAFYNNLPYILDELQIVNDKKDLDNLIYMLTEGSGRSRGNKLGGLEAVPKWKNATITTGERPIVTARSGGGSVNRVLEIECKEKFFAEPREVANFVKANYGAMGKLFIAYLQEEGFSHAEELFTAYQKKLIAEYDIMQKQAQSAALILTADTIAGELLYGEDTNLTPDDIATYLKTKDDVSVNPRAYEYVCEYVAANQLHFIQGDERPIEMWGKLSDGQVCIIKTKFTQICDEGGYNAQSLLSWLGDKGLIEKQNGKNTVVRKIMGVNARCVNMTLPGADGETDTPDIDF